MSKDQGVIVGLDVGYGNVKLSAGHIGEPAWDQVMPAGAAPVDLMPKKIDRSPDLKGGELVYLTAGGEEVEKWVGGVDQMHVQNSTRQTHERYTSTREYQALFLSALAKLGRERVSLLVTGLPVAQYYGERGEELRKGLAALMKGRHIINSTSTVEVDKVVVMPQAVGSFFAVASQPEHKMLTADETMSTLIVDVGFYSADWAVMSGKSVREKSSGSSQFAMSHVMDEAAKVLGERLGRPVDRDKIELAWRRGQPSMVIGGEEVAYREVMAEVGAEISSRVAGQILTSTRNERSGIDVVVATGGGAELFLPAIKNAFPKSKVLQQAEPLMGNARGYQLYGQLLAGAAKRAA
jgi:plasmid segregation protein ParM